MAETTEQYRARINQLKTSIENEPLIRKMRDDIAEGVSKTGNRQADIEVQFQSVIDGTTGKDVISAPEIIAARNGETNLKTRLDKNEQEVTAQLAQTEQQTNSLQTNKVDKTELNNGLSSKVDRGGVEQVTWAMMSQDARENISGDKTAVVGVNSVSTTNIVDGAATLNKRTPLGSAGFMITGEDSTVPNIDSYQSKFVLYAPFFVSYGKTRFTFTEQVDVPFQGSGAHQYLLFNYKTQLFRSLSGSNEHRIDENELIIMVINRSSTHSFKNVFSTCAYTINGKIPSVTEEYVDQAIGKALNVVDFGLILYGGARDRTLFDFDNRTMKIPYPFYVHVKNRRYDFEAGETDSLDIPLLSINNQFIYFNTQDRSFEVFTSAQVRDDIDSQKYTLIAFIQGDEVSTIGRYSTTTQKPDTGSFRDIAFEISMEDINGWYNPDNNETYDLFDYDTTTANEYQDAMSSLAEEYPDYITEINCGLDSSGEYNIYRYKLIPDRVEVPSLDKPFPKIPIVGGLHAGTEKESIFSLYYFIKDICENWQSEPLLEYLRHNVEFDIIPNANPWGFDGGDYRRNFNEVDLNRNFGYAHRSGAVGSVTYGGTHAFSELESQYVRDMMLDCLDGVCFIDYHTNGSSGNVYETLMWISLNNNPFINTNLDIAAKYTISKATREFIKKYEQPNDVGFFGYASNSTLGGTAKSYGASIGLPSVTFECFRKFPSQTELHNPTAVKACTEYLGNFLLNVIRQFRSNNTVDFK